MIKLKNWQRYLSPVRVNFICLANVCRSPMAEALLKDAVKKEGLQGQIRVSSRSIEDWLNGKEAHPQIIDQLDRHHIPHGRLISRQLKASDASKYDYFICMDHKVLSAAKDRLGKEAEGKIYLFNEFLGQDTDVQDPIHTHNFDQAYDDIDAGIQPILQHIKEEENLDQ